MCWENRCIGSVIIVMALCSVASGLTSDDLFSILNEDDTITAVSDIKYDDSKIVNPDIWDTSGFVTAKIDIVGYRYMIEHDGVKYINQTPEASAYVVYEAKHLMTGRRFWTCNVDSFTHNITSIEHNSASNTVKATLKTVLEYHTSILRCRSTVVGRTCRIDKTYYTQTATFTATDYNLPEQYPANLTTQNATVMIYNNSLANKTVISIPFVEYMLGYRVEFKNESVEYFFNEMTMEYLNNSFPYGNVTRAPTQSIYKDSNLFYRIGDKCIINDTNIDDSLKIYAVTPYCEQEMNYTIVNGPNNIKIDKDNAVGIFNIVVLCFLGAFIIRHHGGIR